MKGYKVFNPDWTCRGGFQYEVGKTFTEDVIPVCGDIGLHFCTKLTDCFNCYLFNPENKVAEVEALGDISADTDGIDSRYCTNKIKIVRELSWYEVLDLVNQGRGCTGIDNSGDCNCGDCNSGNYNSGGCNSGNYNSSNYNSGNRNSGNHNSGDYNSGNRNSGHYNTGRYNNGNGNSGDYNSGGHNTDDYNSGDCNTGIYNSGDCNTGRHNSGNYNTGHFNIGNRNTGDWNKANFASGCFNTEPQKIFLFNKPSDWTYQDWINSQANRVLFSSPTSLCWVDKNNMSDEEKEQHPKYLTTNGYLKNVEPDMQAWWDNLHDEDKEIVKAIPNFDAEVFKEITGITV